MTTDGTDGIDDITRARSRAATSEAIAAEFERIGIPESCYFDPNLMMLLGLVGASMTTDLTLDECHRVLDAVATLDPGDRYDVIEDDFEHVLTPQMLDGARVRSTQRHLRMMRVALQEFVYALEDREEEALDRGARVRVEITELRTRAVAGTRFLIGTLYG